MIPAADRPILPVLPVAAPSLALEVFLYFGKLWDVVFWLISFMVFCYKGYNLPYPSNAYEMEFT